MTESIEKKTTKAVIYKMLERIGVQLISFILSIFLARLLEPSDYGIIAMSTIFTNIMYVFVNYGLSCYLIFKKDIGEIDISTCFWASVFGGIILYICLFCIAPFAAAYFNMPLLKSVIRVQGIGIIFSLINSVQVALVAKKFQFKELALCTLISVFISGIIGIILAFFRYGVWALVAQSLINTILITVLLVVPLKWQPKLLFSKKALMDQVGYSWKLIIVGFVDCIYSEIRSLAIAKKYNSTQLAYYNKADQFPKLVSNTVNQTVISVFFPALSTLRDNNEKMIELMKKSISLLIYVLFPVLLGMAAVSDELIIILLTDKWATCISYLKILACAYMIAPIQYVYKQMLKATDNGKILLMINIAEKIFGTILLIPAVMIGVKVIAWSLVAYHIFGLILYIISAKVKMRFSIKEQLKIFFSNGILAMIMFIILQIITMISTEISPLLFLLFKVVIGGIIYILLSILLKNENYNMIIDLVRKRK